MSLTEISVRVALVTVLAVGALVAIGWRRPAPDYPPHERARRAPDARNSDSAELETKTNGSHEHKILVRPLTRRVLDVLGLGSIAAFIGVLVALTTSMAIAWMVTALLNRL